MCSGANAKPCSERFRPSLLLSFASSYLKCPDYFLVTMHHIRCFGVSGRISTNSLWIGLLSVGILDLSSERARFVTERPSESEQGGHFRCWRKGDVFASKRISQTRNPSSLGCSLPGLILYSSTTYMHEYHGFVESAVSA